MGVLRIHFTGADLVRTRVADRPDPLWETVLSLRALQVRSGWPDADEQRRGIVVRHADELRMLLPLVRRRGYFPDFLTPPEGALGFAEGLEALLRTAKPRLGRDLQVLGSETKLPSWVRDLADGRPTALRRLGAALHGYYRGAVAPVEEAMRTRVRVERATRMRVMDESGVEAMLAGLHPSMRWESPVLEVDYSVDQELHLNGRGLLLVPTMFRSRTPVSLLDPALPPILTYPIPRQERPGAEGADRRLEPLVGRTRAAVLRAIEDGSRATTELARLLEVSAACISQHTTVLREAGLISSDRHRSLVLHTLTPLGAALVRGACVDLRNRAVPHRPPRYRGAVSAALRDTVPPPRSPVGGR